MNRNEKEFPLFINRILEIIKENKECKDHVFKITDKEFYQFILFKDTFEKELYNTIGPCTVEIKDFTVHGQKLTIRRKEVKMDNKKLKRALELKEQIEELEDFIEYIRDCDLKGEIKIKKPRVIFNYKSWRNKEKTFEFNERLTFCILLQVDKELEDLKMQYERL